MKKISGTLSISDFDENGVFQIVETGAKGEPCGEIVILPEETLLIIAHLTKRAADWLMWSAKQWFMAQFANR